MNEPMGLATRWKIWYFLTRTVFRRAYGYHNERVPRGMYDMLYSDKEPKFQVIVKGRSCPATERINITQNGVAMNYHSSGRIT